MKPRATMPILQTMGMLATLWPISLRSVATWRLAKLYGSSGDWYRWGATAVLNWKPSKDVERIPLTHIHGDRDRTFPLRYTKADIVIHGGGHVLTLTTAIKLQRRCVGYRSLWPMFDCVSLGE